MQRAASAPCSPIAAATISVLLTIAEVWGSTLLPILSNPSIMVPDRSQIESSTKDLKEYNLVASVR